jgi:hypothetical protein
MTHSEYSCPVPPPTHRQIRCALWTMLPDSRPADKLESLLRVPLCCNLLHHPSKRLFIVRLTEMTDVHQAMFPARVPSSLSAHLHFTRSSQINKERVYSRKRMLDDPWTCVYSYEHPDIEIDGQADDGLDVPTIPSCRGGYHREDQSEGLEEDASSVRDEPTCSTERRLTPSCEYSALAGVPP